MRKKEKTEKEEFLFGFQMDEADLLVRHFELMAEQGWMLKELWELNIAVYEPIQPKKVHFSYLLTRNMESAGPKEKDRFEELVDMASAMDWNYVADYANKIQIFYSEAEDPVPMDTSPEFAFENFHKTNRWGAWGNILTGLGVLLSGIGIIITKLGRGLDLADLLYGSTPLPYFLWIILAILYTVHGVHYLQWHHAEKKNLESAGTYTAFTYQNHMVPIVVALLIPLILFLFILFTESVKGLSVLAVITVAVFLLLGWLLCHFFVLRKTPENESKIRKTRNKYLVLLGVLFVLILTAEGIQYHNVSALPKEGEAFPLTAADIFSEDVTEEVDDKECGYSGNLFFSQMFFDEMNEEGSSLLYYDIYQTAIPSLSDYLLDKVMDEECHTNVDDEGMCSYSLKEIDATSWNAEKAYAVWETYDNETTVSCYIMVYPDYILTIYPDANYAGNSDEFTDNQKQIISEKINNYVNN